MQKNGATKQDVRFIAKNLKSLVGENEMGAALLERRLLHGLMRPLNVDAGFIPAYDADFVGEPKILDKTSLVFPLILFLVSGFEDDLCGLSGDKPRIYMAILHGTTL